MVYPFENYYRNPYRAFTLSEVAVDTQLEMLRLADEEEGWKIPEETFEHLVQTASAWPRGEFACRSLRIRFGHQDSGVEETYRDHWRRLEHIYGEGFSDLSYDAKPGVHPIRLARGNDSHKPVIEWINIDFDPYRDGYTLAMQQARSLADELLVFAWMFADQIRRMASSELSPMHVKRCEIHASGYRIDAPVFPDDRNQFLKELSLTICWGGSVALYSSDRGYSPPPYADPTVSP